MLKRVKYRVVLKSGPQVWRIICLLLLPPRKGDGMVDPTMHVVDALVLVATRVYHLHRVPCCVDPFRRRWKKSKGVVHRGGDHLKVSRLPKKSKSKVVSFGVIVRVGGRFPTC